MFVLLTLPPRQAGLAQSEVDITITPAQSELTVGDVVLLTLEIRHPVGTRAIIPALPQQWGEFEVRSQSPAETIPNPDSSLSTVQTIAVTLFTPGQHVSPGIEITLQDEVGQVRVETSPGVTLTVLPVLEQDDMQLRDIKPQARMKVPFSWVWLPVSVLLAGLAGAFAWHHRRLRGNATGALPPDQPEPPPAHEAALAELDSLAHQKLPEAGQFKVYYTLLSDCLRRYLEARFDLSALERTSAEMQLELRRASLQPEVAQGFLYLLNESDLVKFARHQPSPASAYQHLEQARALVSQTAPGSQEYPAGEEL